MTKIVREREREGERERERGRERESVYNLIVFMTMVEMSLLYLWSGPNEISSFLFINALLKFHFAKIMEKLIHQVGFNFIPKVHSYKSN